MGRVIDKIKTWTFYLVYAFLVSPNTIVTYTSRSPRLLVSINFYSRDSIKLAILESKNIVNAFISYVF